MVPTPTGQLSRPPSNPKVDASKNKQPESPKMIGGKKRLDQKDIDMIINSKY
jgi:hypothetical protein